MPHHFAKRNWVAIAVVSALALGTFWNHQAVDKAVQARQQVQRDQIQYNLKACGRGHVLRTQFNEALVAIEDIKVTVQGSIDAAAKGNPFPGARQQFEAQSRKLDQIKLEPVDDPNCQDLVRQQTPAR